MWKKARVIMCVLLFVGFGAVVLNLFRWQIVRGEELRTAALEQSLRSTKLTAQRGTIYDATGSKVLAKSASVWTVVLEPAYITGETKEEEEALRRTISSGLSKILDMDEEKIYQKASDKTSYFTYLKRQVETDVRDEINAFLKENNITAGVQLIDDFKRYYPYGSTASTVLGFTDIDGQGLEGLELEYNNELRGTAGRLVSAKNALGTDMPFEYEQFVGAEDGYDLVLTIDETVQSILEKYLAQGIEEYKIRNGAVAIMMNVKTGGIIGLASNGYDPNNPREIYDKAAQKAIELLPESEQEEATVNALHKQWRNKAVSDTYYPGSVYKMCTGAMGIEEGLVTETSQFTCTGNMAVEGVTDGISCWKHEGHGTETFREGLYNSCNPWFIHVGELLGPHTFAKYREAFGFTEQTGIDLPGESWSIYHDEEDLGPAELATEAFGQNFSITPVQMITACAAIANGGYLVTPHVVDRVVDSEGNIVRTADTSYRRQVISEETSKLISSILYDNATFGTAKNGYVMGYRVCGKTGTSEKVAEHNQKPDEDMQYIASYCGFAPVEDPQYALLVFFDEPQKELNGGLTGGNAVAGPIFSMMMQEALPYLGIEARYTDEEYESLDLVSPVLVGKTLTEAYAELDAMGLSYSVIGDESDGSAVVTEQIPQSGGTVPRDGKVVLYTKGYDEAATLTEMPDFAGMDIMNASYTALTNGIQISIVGAAAESGGIVSIQSVAPGEKVRYGTVVALTFVETTNTEAFVSLGE